MPQKSGKRSKSRENLQPAHAEKPQYAYTLLSAEHSKEITEGDFSSIENVVCKLHGFDTNDIAVNLKQSAIMNYYVSALWFAKEEQRFTEWQISTLYAIIHTLLKQLQENSATIAQNCATLREMLTNSTLDDWKPERPASSREKDGRGREAIEPLEPQTREGFTLEQSKAIADYIFSTLFQHYSLYIFLFTRDQEVIQLDENRSVEVAPLASLPWPPPLCEGIAEETYTKYLAPKQTSQLKQLSAHAASAGKDESAGALQSQAAADASAERTLLDKEDKLEYLLSSVALDTVKKVIEDSCNEVLRGVEADILNGLRDKENAFITRINKIHFPTALTPESANANV